MGLRRRPGLQRLILVANNFDPKRKGACKPRGLFTLTGTTVTSLSTTWWQEEGAKQLKGSDVLRRVAHL